MDISADLTRIALAEDGELKELYYESKREESLVGNVYAGRVANVMPNLQAAFVDIGAEKNGKGRTLVTDARAFKWGRD